MAAVGTTRWAIIAALAAMAWAIPSSAATTAAELKRQLAEGEVKVIDIRPNVYFKRGHIPGAINITATIVDKKKLPEWGAVVVVGDGVHQSVTDAAVAALNLKPGITADRLNGGYPAWLASGEPTTQAQGMYEGHHTAREISYDQLVTIAATEAATTVLVDLREPGDAHNTELSAGPFSALHRLPLSSGTPATREAREKRLLATVLGQRGAAASKLYVLIDDGDGRSNDTARRLWAAGVRRIAVLVGGEHALAVEGRAGVTTITSVNGGE